MKRAKHLSSFYIKLSLHLSREEIEGEIRRRVQTVYLGDKTVLARVMGRLKIYLHTDDVGFAGHVMLDGYWESWLTIFLAGITEPGMTVVDVGANFGYYSVLMGDIVGSKGRLVAVEPNPVAAGYLRRTLDLNGISGHARLVSAALGDGSTRVVDMIVPPGEPKNAFVAGEGMVGDRITVPSIPLDELLAGEKRVDIIKIDAEGSETAIIDGGWQAISRHRPHLVLEYNAARYADPQGFLARLLDIYGKVHAISTTGRTHAVDPQEIHGDRSGEDALLFFRKP